MVFALPTILGTRWHRILRPWCARRCLPGREEDQPYEGLESRQARAQLLSGGVGRPIDTRGESFGAAHGTVPSVLEG